MKKCLTSKNNIRFFSFLIKYILIVCMVVLSFIPIYSISYTNIKNSIVNENLSTLDKGMLNLGNNCNRLVELAQVCSIEPTIKKIINMDNSITSSNYYDLIQSQNFLRSIFISDNVVSNSYIISKKNNFFLSSAIIDIDRNNTFKGFYQFGDYSYDQWIDTIFNCTGKYEFIPSLYSNSYFTPTETAAKSNKIHLVAPIPQKNIYSKTAAMVFILDEKEILSSLISSELISKGFLYITDRNGNVILNANYNNADLLSTSERIFSTTFNNTHATVIKSGSNQTGLTAVVGIPDAIFVQKTKSILNLMIIYLLVATLIAVLVSAYMAYKDTLPIKKLLSVAQGFSNDASDYKNDYTYISDTLSTLHIERSQYQKELASHEASISNYLIDNVLNGRIYSCGDISKVRNILQPSSDYFCVCTMHINLSHDLLLDENYNEMETRIKLIVKGVLEQSSMNFPYFHTIDSGITTMIFELVESEDVSNHSIFALLTQIASTINNNIYPQNSIQNVNVPANVFFGIGTISYDIENIYISHKNSLSALRYCDITNPVSMYVHADSFLKRMIIDASISQRFKDILISGEKSDLINLFETRISSAFKYDGNNDEEVCQDFFTLRGVLNDVVIEYGLYELKDDLPKYAENKSFSMLLSSIRDYSIILCDALIQKRTSKRDKNKIAMVTYIEENYMDSNLSAITISGKFSISEKYIFTIIKDITGKSLGEYIEHVRFKKTEELLKTSISINNIPELVGYNSTNTFYKAFKRIYGVSPGKWRESQLDSHSIL